MSDRTLRPLALGDVFDEGFDLYKRNFLLFLLITAVWIIPLYIVRAFVFARLGHPLLNLDFTSDVDSGSMVMDAFEQLAVVCLLLPMSVSVMWVALSTAASGCYLGRPVTLAAAYREGFKRIVSVIAGTALLGLSYAAGLLLCGIGVLWPAVVFVFAGQTFSMEHKSPVAALKRSNSLVSGDSGRVFGALLLFVGFGFLLKIGFGALVNYLLSLLFHILPGSGDMTSSVLFAGAPGKRDKILDDLAMGITQLVLIPFAVSVVTVLYFDFRVRKEAFDIELLAEDLGYPPLDTSPAATPAYMPPVMPVGAGGRLAPGGWTPPGSGRNPGPSPAPGWMPPGQPVPPGWGQSGQPAPPGWGQPGQPVPPGWGQTGQPVAPGWTQQGQPGQPMPPGWAPPGSPSPTGWRPPPAPGWAQQGQSAPQPPDPGTASQPGSSDPAGGAS